MRRASKQQRLRHRLITDWRGVEGAPLIENPAQALREFLPAILHEWKLDERMRLDDAAPVWRRIVGDFIAKQTAPDALKRGILTVRVLQPMIHHTLAQQKPSLLKKLQDHFGPGIVKDIRFRHG